MNQELYDRLQNTSARLGVSLGAVIRASLAHQLDSLTFDAVQEHESRTARTRNKRTRARNRARELLQKGGRGG